MERCSTLRATFFSTRSAMKAAGFDKFFRDYSERAVRGRAGRDPWVSVRSPFGAPDILEQDALPNIFETEKVLFHDDSYEVAQPSSLSKVASAWPDSLP